MYDIACKLGPMGNGHNKFLRFIHVTYVITAERGWWQEFATYRFGVEVNSQSTMHTLLKRPLVSEDFGIGIPQNYIDYINTFIKAGDLITSKKLLPESFLQQRLVKLSYAAILNIYNQRKTHRLPEWQMLCSAFEALPHIRLMGLPPKEVGEDDDK
jgi:hypothetical protein